MQTICLEIFRHYEVAFAELKREAPAYLFEQRFIVDLDENTTFTLQIWNPKTARLCYSKISFAADHPSSFEIARPGWPPRSGRAGFHDVRTGFL